MRAQTGKVNWWGKDAPTSDGWAVIEFAESFCRTVKTSPAAQRGDLVKLRKWQKEIILEIFRTDRNGKRLYRRGLLGLPRKNGKSMLGAIIALYCLVADGQGGAEVYSVAADKDQARIVFNEVMEMVRLEPELSAVLIIRDTFAEILHPASGSFYRAIASDSKTAEGLNPTCVIFDEVHVQRDAKLWTVMTNGSATRATSLILGITTAGYDLATQCGRLYKMGKAGTTPGFYFRWWEPANPECDFNDEEVWKETNPGLGDFQVIDDFRLAAAEAAETGQELSFRRYRLNQWTGAVEAWLGFGVWDRLAGGDELSETERIVLGFDGSFNGDSTGIVGCSVDRDVPHLQKLAVWERPDGDAGVGWEAPILEIEARIIELCKNYHVAEVACDPYRWQRSMAVLAEAGVPVSAFPTGSAARMIPATTVFTDHVRDGVLNHDGDDDLRRHIQNTHTKTDSKGPRIVKENKNSAKKIDLAVCAVVALDRALNQPEEDDQADGFNVW